VHWELTNRCNLRCIHCYQQDDAPDATLPSTEILFAIAQRIVDANVFELTLTGGEIMMVPQLPEVIDFFNNAGIEPHITSNGTLVSERRADQLAERRLTFQVSIDSADPSVHDGVRQRPGALGRAVRGIERLVERKVPVSIAYTCMPQNADAAPGVVELAARVGVEKVCIGEVLPFFGDEERRAEMAHSADNLNDARRRLVALAVEYEDRVDLRLAFQGLGATDSDPIRRPCTALERDLAVLHDGSAYPCPFVRRPTACLGSVLDSSIRDIWNSSAAQRFRSEKAQLPVPHCHIEATPAALKGPAMLPMLGGPSTTLPMFSEHDGRGAGLGSLSSLAEIKRAT
jgi:MoaA/NifB/PqqE/SkfB family radical SAM enzyme